jgi:transaldolase
VAFESSNLRLFIDSVDEKHWKAYLTAGLFYGVITNPRLLARSGFEFNLELLKNELTQLAAESFQAAVENRGS